MKKKGQDQRISVSTRVKAPLRKVWETWTSEKHITGWNSPSPEWHTPRATHQLQAGKKFNYRMEARDGSMGFDYSGTFDRIEPNKQIAYTLDDNRKVQIRFSEKGGETEIVETFDPEDQNSREMQQQGWQAILDSFKKYTETLK